MKIHGYEVTVRTQRLVDGITQLAAAAIIIEVLILIGFFSHGEFASPPWNDPLLQLLGYLAYGAGVTTGIVECVMIVALSIDYFIDVQRVDNGGAEDR